MSITPLEELFDQFDLMAHIASLRAFFSREQPLFIEGDQERHFRYIEALDALEFKAPPKIEAFESPLVHLKKSGVLHFDQIFEIVKLVRYFRYLKNRDFSGIIGEWMQTIEIHDQFGEIDPYFNEDGSFNEERDEALIQLSGRMKSLKGDIAAQLKRMLHTQKLSSYLVDQQVHYMNDEECLLVRGGFNHVLKGSVIGRSTAGFFYVSPEAISRTKEQIKAIESEREGRLYEYAKRFSAVLKEMVLFIGFIDREFNRFDHYQARVLFARSKDFAIMKAESKSDSIVLKGFEHPALHKPKPVAVDFSRAVLMITGVNAGGKTMLLKSILSAAAMAKYLVPMKINKHHSHIGSFKQVLAVIDDPQSVSNDISTFAGRMLQFSKLFDQRSALIGVDEIELGTDSDEAAALFKVMLDDLIARGQKIVVTTHHKRLAALMADRDDVELMAAIYDEERRVPTYEFLQGIIGKSYAFETALRYGIASGVVERAKTVYGEQHEKLNLLIERGSELERELKRKNALLDEKLEAVAQQERELKETRERSVIELKMHKQKLRHEYEQAINEAKEAAKEKDTAAIHRQMNKAKAKLPEEQESSKLHETTPERFEVGQVVKYRKQRGTIVSLKAKEAMIEVEGMRLRVKLNELKASEKLPKKAPKVDVKASRNTKGSLKLDLHGKRADEAEEMLDKFLSDALVQGWDEVIVYHGIGTGKLAYAVKEFLKRHPKVKKFEDAPQHMGGYGAKLVTL